MTDKSMTDNRVLLFFRNLSTIGLPVVTLFSATAQLFVYFLNQYWLKILGITYQLNVVESLYVSFGMILITTVGLIIFYGLILVLSFSLLRDGIELAKKFPLITKLNLFIYAFINKSDLTRKVSDSTKTWFPAVFVVLPFFLMILWGTSKFKFFVWPLITATSFLCFLLVMIALRNWLSAFIDWGRKVPNFTEDAASESKLMSYIKSIVFISIGFLVPSVIIFLHMWDSYWIYASFIGVVMSAHVASFIYINQKNLIGVVISIVLFILLAFAYWFDIGSRLRTCSPLHTRRKRAKGISARGAPSQRGEASRNFVEKSCDPFSINTQKPFPQDIKLSTERLSQQEGNDDERQEED